MFSDSTVSIYNFATEWQKVRTIQFVFSSVLIQINLKNIKCLWVMLFALLLLFFTHKNKHSVSYFQERQAFAKN